MKIFYRSGYDYEETKLASNAEWYTLCVFASKFLPVFFAKLLVGAYPQSPLNSSVAGAGCAFLRNALTRARPAKNCIMEMCITDHSTDGKRHSQGMEKPRLSHTQQTAFTTAP